MYKSIKIYTKTRCQVSIYRTTGPLVLAESLLAAPVAEWLRPLIFSTQNPRHLTAVGSSLGDLQFLPHLMIDLLKMSEIFLTQIKTQIKKTNFFFLVDPPSCPANKITPCFANPCEETTCTNHPGAKCR